MSKWKTSTRRNRKLTTNESAGNLSLPSSYGEPESDNSSLSFLDDMLSGGGVGGGGRKQQQPQQNQHYQQQPQGDIDDILDLVGSTHNDGSRSRGGSGSNSSGGNGIGLNGHHRRGDNRLQSEQQADPYATSHSPVRSRGLHRYGSGGARSQSRSLSRGQPSRDHPLDPASRPSTSDAEYRRSYTSNYGVDGREESSGSTDHVTPIPVFTVNANHYDDDSLSQITTSVTSHYDVDSSRSGSFPWSKSRAQPKNPSHSESSYADTLDEIADMLHPANSGGRMTPNRQSNEHLLRHPKSPGGHAQPSHDDFFRPPNHPSTSPHDVLGKANHNDAPPLNADEIYRSSKKSHRSWGEPLLSQTRLLFRYWMSLAVPREWRRKVGGKVDEQGYLGIYHTSPKKLPRSRHRRRICSSVVSSSMGFFFCMTVLMLVMRLTFLHAPNLPRWARFNWDDSSVEGGDEKHKNRPHKKGAARHSVVAAEVHGGMAVRSDNEASNAGAVAGGMAHHDGDELLQLPPTRKGDYSHHGHIGIELPAALDHFADVTDLPVRKGDDLPFFWHIPRAAGGTINDVFGGCLGLTLASDAGGSGEAGKENKLKKVKFSKHFTYVNVDTSTPEGIERARQLKLADSQLADVVIGTLLHQTASLFSSRHRGRMFTIVRHPVERAVSLFHYVQDTQWRRRQSFQKELSELSIQEYFESGLAENNWMTRFLINEPTKGELTRDDVNLAKEILRRKCLVGLLSQKGESFARFERYFGFPLKDDEQKDCHEKKLQWAWPLKHRHDEVEENSPLWDLILTHNVFDMELFHYASEVVFDEQAKIFQ